MAENMIKFLRGSVANLPAQATAGAVYFTKDEGLYLGLEDGSYHRYGDFITVENVASLPEAGAHETCMYYCESENILAKWDGSTWVQINKQKTLVELGGVAKSVYEAKIALLEQADSDNAKATGDLKTYVGTIPETSTAKDIVAYVQEKTAGIATDTALEELTGRVTIAEGDIDKLEAALAEGGTTGKAIADAQKAADDAQAAVDALSGKVGTVADGKTVVGLIEAAQTQADKGVDDAATAQARADEAYNLANGKATMTEVNSAISTAIAESGHAVKSEVEKAIADMDAAYKKADGDLKTELQGKIDEKVAQADYNTKVAALDKEDARLAGLISDMDTAYKAADKDQTDRIAALEGTITGLSGAMHFKGVKDAMPEGEALDVYVDGDVIIVGDKEYVFNEGAFVEFGDVSAEGDRIAALEGVVGKAAEGDNAATGLVKAVADNAAAIAAEKDRAEGEEAKLAQADATNLQAAKDYADAAVEALGIADYVKKTDADKDYAAAGHNHDDKYDAIGAAAQALEDAQAYADQAEADALSEAKKYTDALANGQVKTNTDAIATKADQSALESHTGNTTVHITADERTAWNAAEQNAKSYADGLKTTIDKAYADADTALKTELQGYADTAEADAIATAKTYTDTALTWGSF